MNNSPRNDFPRLSQKEILILEMLSDRGEMFGLEMVEASAGGLKRGTIYVTLSRMCDKGYVESREAPRQAPEIGIPRRVYRVTGLGQSAYSANIQAANIFSRLAFGGHS